MDSAGIGRADADRLAPVTYLPGVRSASAASQHDESTLSETVSCDQSASCDQVESERARAERITMHALTRRGVSTSELRSTLGSRGLADDVVEYELARLERVGLLDDAELAETLVRTLRERKRLGRTAIAAELQRRGIARDTIAAALQEQSEDDHDELERAVELAMQRADRLRSLDSATARRRLAGFLMRRGYPGGIVSAAVERALAHKTSAGPVFR